MTAAFASLYNGDGRRSRNDAPTENNGEALYQKAGTKHEFWKYAIGASLLSQGDHVKYAVALCSVGACARADIMYEKFAKDQCEMEQFGVVDVKTREFDDFTVGQKVVHPNFNHGFAYSDSPKIMSFGLPMHGFLPAGAVTKFDPGNNWTYYPPGTMRK